MKAINDSHFVYVLKCGDGKLYTGYTSNLPRRLRLHNLGVASKFTRGRKPFSLVHLESYNTKSEALKRELEIKRMKRSGKLKLVLYKAERF